MVYEAAEDSFLILNHIKQYAQGKSVLDMGTGSGVLAEEALLFASAVAAVDISADAVKTAKARLEGARVIQSNLFSKIKGGFDLILFNAPYLPDDEYGNRETDGGKHGHEVIERFLVDAKKHLNPKGVILLVFSSLTNKRRVDIILKTNGYKHRLIEKKPLFFERLFLYEIRL
jgi:release factor glutamine methyltransferase